VHFLHRSIASIVPTFRFSLNQHCLEKETDRGILFVLVFIALFVVYYKKIPRVNNPLNSFIMIEHVHKHITSELQQNTKTDTIFILTAILLNLIALAVNSILVEDSRTNNSLLIVMYIFVFLIVVVNVVVIFGIMKGKQTRMKLVDGLLRMYKDQGVDKYYDESLLSNYSVRYNLFIMVVVATGIIASVVPFVVR